MHRTNLTSKVILFILIICPLVSKASDNFQQTLGIGLGIVNVSLTENVSALESDSEDTEEETTSTVTPLSVFSLDFTYEFKQYVSKTLFIKSVLPLLSPEGSGYYMGGVGMNVYFNSLSSIFTFKDEGTSLRVTPTIRYYYGGVIGGGYLVYNTETAKKSDITLDLSVHGGAIYNIKDSWAIKGEAAVGRVTGINTSGIAMKVFFSGIYFLPN